MVNDTMYRKIQSYKQQGYTIRRCARTIDVDRKTVRKYWNMTAEEYVKYLAESKKRTRILDPYWDEMASELEEYPNITSAVMHDHLRERHEGFQASYRSVHLYVTALREELGIPTEVKIRQYTEVNETAPGQGFSRSENLRGSGGHGADGDGGPIRQEIEGIHFRDGYEFFAEEVRVFSRSSV